MNNELKIKPLLRYEVTLNNYGNEGAVEAFTADSFVRDDDALLFYRTGNLIRMYLHPLPSKIIATPADEAELQK